MMSSKSYRVPSSVGESAGPRHCRFLRASWGWSILLLSLGLVWQWNVFRFGAAHEPRSTVFTEDGFESLDSFSEPAVAMAILKQHVENLHAYALVHNVTNDALRLSRSAQVAVKGMESTSPEPAELSSPNHERRRNGQSRWDSAQWSLAELQGRIRALHGEVLQKSLLIRFHQHAWNDYLDSYLDLLRVGPEQADVVLLGHSALACAGTCGRTDEVLDALRHFARFSQDSQTVARMQDLLADWRAGKIRQVAANNSSVSEAGPICLAKAP